MGCLSLVLIGSIALAGVRWSGGFHPAPAPKGGFWTPHGGWVVFRHEFPDRGVALRAMLSGDEGRTWTPLGIVAQDDDREADIGDGNALELPDGRWLAVFRRNHLRGGGPKRFAIEVAQSADRGRTWTRHSVVTEHQAPATGPSRGLWAPLLFLTPSGELQCYYDDENLPFERGAPGHQWVAMRRWLGSRWSEPVVVAKEPGGLSRDGMPAVAAVGGRLVCLFEGVRPNPPHDSVIRMAESRDGGRSWSSPRVVFEARPPGCQSVAPTVAARDGRIVAVFCTNHGRRTSVPSGSPPPEMRLDVVSMWSADGGRTWSEPETVYSGTSRNYLPSLAQTPDGRLLLSFLDYDRGALATTGRWR
ncbi:MAG: sialidase family protein [Fimbriimonadaceae bacterium]